MIYNCVGEPTGAYQAYYRLNFAISSYFLNNIHENFYIYSDQFAFKVIILTGMSRLKIIYRLLKLLQDDAIQSVFINV